MQEVEKYKSKLKNIQTYIQSLVINWVNKQKRGNKKWNVYQINTSFAPDIRSRVT